MSAMKALTILPLLFLASCSTYKYEDKSYHYNYQNNVTNPTPVKEETVSNTRTTKTFNNNYQNRVELDFNEPEIITEPNKPVISNDAPFYNNGMKQRKSAVIEQPTADTYYHLPPRYDQGVRGFREYRY